MPAPIDVFISFVQEDDALRSELEKHLSALTQIRTWSARHVQAGQDPGAAVEARLKAAQVILLLVSADYLASEMVQQAELTLALARHKSWEARVIPVIVRPCEWSQAPFARLMPLPSAGKAVTAWLTHDDAWADVARGLLEVIGQIADAWAKPSKLTPAYRDEETRGLSERLGVAEDSSDRAPLSRCRHRQRRGDRFGLGIRDPAATTPGWAMRRRDGADPRGHLQDGLAARRGRARRASPARCEG